METQLKKVILLPIYICGVDVVLDRLALSTQKALGLNFEFCELLFIKYCEVVSMQTILQTKLITK